MNTLVLSALFGGNIWVALAQQPAIIPYPLTNATTIIPTSTPSACANKCSVHYPHITAVQWIPEAQIVYTEQVTIATLEIVTYIAPNVTVSPITRTIWRPDLTTKYSNSLFKRGTGAQGTQVVTIRVPDAKWGSIDSEFTFPTGYIDYASSYSWQGVLQTKKSSSSICATATSSPQTVILPSHPNYPQPTDGIPVDKSDPFGQKYVPIYVPFAFQPDKSFLSASFPSETAFQKCEPVSPPPSPTSTFFSIPKFITVTTTLTTYIGAPAIRIESSASGFEDPRTDNRPPSPPTRRPENSFAIPDIKTTNVPDPYLTPPTPPQPQSTLRGNEAQQSNGNPSLNLPNPTTRGYPSNQTPVLTTITTTINGVATTVVAYVIAGASTTLTATVGQTVTLDNGQVTVLSAPAAYYTSVSTTINGTPTVVPVLVVDGTSTASIGQTAVVGGRTTVVGTPSSSVTGPANFEGAADRVGLNFAYLTVVIGVVFLVW